MRKGKNPMHRVISVMSPCHPVTKTIATNTTSTDLFRKDKYSQHKVITLAYYFELQLTYW